MKKCNRCGANKPLDDFHRRAKSADGRTGHCKECQKIAKRKSDARVQERIGITAWRARQVGYVAEYKNRHPDRVENHQRSNHLKRVFGITVKQYEEMLKSQGSSVQFAQSFPQTAEGWPWTIIEGVAQETSLVASA